MTIPLKKSSNLAYTIPLHRPSLNEKAMEYIEAVFDSDKLSGDGRMCRAVEQKLQNLFSVEHALLTTSCTHALEMAMDLLDLQPGDEVVMPSFTFVSTANAVLRAGGRPVFCEIEDQTQSIDVNDFERRVTGRTRGVIPVHYAGVSADMDPLLEIARVKKIAVIEDAAQGVNARYKGRYLGTIGEMAAYSFHDTKNYVSGEGGAFLTSDTDLARRAEIIREKGTDRANFLRGFVDKYTWVERGSSYVLSEILAAVLRSQLDDLDSIQSGRERVHSWYVQGLEDMERAGRLRLPVLPPYCQSNYHIFYILLRDAGERDRVMQHLKSRGIATAFHYVPLHSAPYAVNVLGTGSLKLPVTDRIFQTLLRLPIYPQLSEDEVGYIIEAVRSALSD